MAEITETGAQDKKSNGIFEALVNNISGIFGGISSVIQASTGNYPDVYYVEKEDNTGKYIAIGGVVLVIVVVLLVLLRK